MNLLNSKELNEIMNFAKKDKNIIALILFGSYARGKNKTSSDIDLCIIRKEDTLPHEFKILDYKNEVFDIHFFDKMPDYIKFRIFKEGRILILNEKKTYCNLRKRFLHRYRDEFPFREYRLKKMVDNI